jgi:putative transposase
MATHLRTELVVDALQMAVWRRKPAAGLVHHSDRGTQYSALSFSKKPEEARIVNSVGRAGSALDAPANELRRWGFMVSWFVETGAVFELEKRARR